MAAPPLAARCSWIQDNATRCERRPVATLHDGTELRPVCSLHAFAGVRVGWTPDVCADGHHAADCDCAVVDHGYHDERHPECRLCR